MRAEAKRLEMLQSKEGRKKRVKSRKVGINSMNIFYARLVIF